MSFSLFDATIPAYLQVLGAVSGLLDKAEAFCADTNVRSDEIIQARLAEDMHPFAYQVKSVAVHSLGAIEGVRKGVFSPDRSPPPQDLVTLKMRVNTAFTELKGIDPAEINSFIGRNMKFAAGELELNFTAENFLLSFSQPNFYFHATTTYNILRWKGVAIGKRDFIGKPRVITDI